MSETKTTKVKPTAAPWAHKHALSPERIFIECHKGRLAVTTGATSEDEANARLIASAPELLESLKDAVEIILSLDCTDNSCDPSHEFEIHQLRELIARAEGK